MATIDGGLELESVHTASDGTRKLLLRLTVCPLSLHVGISDNDSLWGPQPYEVCAHHAVACSCVGRVYTIFFAICKLKPTACCMHSI